MTRIHVVLLGFVLAGITLAGCGGGNETSKAGGSGAPITLRMGTNDGVVGTAALQIEEFARQVEELSGGTLRIEPVFEVVGQDGGDWDQQVARMVIRGELDLASVPARAWDIEGVTSLRALHAPFLVTTDELLRRVVTSELAPRMLAGLEPAGVVGLALVPESLRHPFAFGEPLLSPGDYAGVVMRVPLSAVSFSLFEALGATPESVPGDEYEQAVMEGSVTATETAYGLADSLPTAAIVTGNVTFFPKANSLVVNADVFDGLDAEQRGILEEAAARTLRWAVEVTPTDAAAAQAFCELAGSHTVVMASEADVAALEQAAAPVYAELERDAETKSLIDAIRALAAEVAVSRDPVVAPCGESGPVTASGDPSLLDGVYRTSFTLGDLRRSPLLYDEGELNDGNWGDLTLTLDRGLVTFALENDVGSYSTSGTFSVDGDTFVLEFTEGENAGETFAGRWRLQDGTLTFTRDDALGILPTPYLVEPWERRE
jgi:TRAP-type C4-dicarboxylate transport system substrate-binding protein